MAINQPYYRIARPMVSVNPYGKYMLDNSYANDRSMLCRSYRILEDDLKVIFGGHPCQTSVPDTTNLSYFD